MRPTVVNGVVVPNTMTEGTDVTTTWIYDTHRTPRLLEMLGRPELESTIAIEPTRRRDVLQTPGLFDQYRQVQSPGEHRHRSSSDRDRARTAQRAGS